MMKLFRKKSLDDEVTTDSVDLEPGAEPSGFDDTEAETKRSDQPYQAWSPEVASPKETAVDTGEGLAPQLIEPDPSLAESLPTPPGIPEEHPLSGQIARALSAVYDPEIPVDIYQLGLVYNVTLNENNDAQILMTLTTPGCPVAGSMPGMVEHAVQTMVDGIGDVEVELVWDPPWTPDMMSEAAQLELGFM